MSHGNTYSSSIKISELDLLTGSAVTIDDFFPIVDSSSLITKRITVEDMYRILFSSSSNGKNTNILFQSGSVITSSNNFN